ncbi:hypothetical protein [Psychrobacillus sp. L3]|uniref:hypothetical protein n=1 Tax=Psychrobacillus sp. L3 TaxID=3236891 RepID=UPI0036F3AA12
MQALQIEMTILFMEVMIRPDEYANIVGADALHAFFPTAFRAMGKEAIASGRQFRVFTVNDEMYANMLQEIGIHKIFTFFWKNVPIFQPKNPINRGKEAY